MKRSVQTFSLILLPALLLAAGDSAARTERVRWTHPDGANIDSFQIHVGPSSRNYASVIEVTDPSVGADGAYFQDLTVADDATVYIAMTAHADGVASRLSNERVRTGTVTDPGGSTTPGDTGSDPTGGTASAAIQGFALWDAQTDTLIDADFTDGSTIDLDAHPCTAIEVIANAYLSTMDSPGSVSFTFDSDTPTACSDPGLTHENQPPYAWEEELGPDQFECAPSLATAGSHKLTITPFDGDNCTGAAGPQVSVSFEVIAGGSGSDGETAIGKPGQPQVLLE